jgi:hypothetical protein
MSLCDAQDIVVARPISLYEARLDIQLIKKSCFARVNSVQVAYFEEEKAFKKSLLDTSARFIICYNRAHALVLSREAAEQQHFILFDSLEISELSQNLLNREDLAAESLQRSAAIGGTRISHQVQFDLASCLPFSVVYIHLRNQHRLGHELAVRKLRLLRHRQVRELALIILGIIRASSS